MENKKTGVLLGKFMPLHKGHCHLIEKCIADVEEQGLDKLLIYVCFTRGETITLEYRIDNVINFIKTKYSKLFEKGIVEVQPWKDQMPNSEDGRVSDQNVSTAWAKAILDKVPTVKKFYGSEPYVKMMADTIGVDYCIFNRNSLDDEYGGLSATVCRTNMLRALIYNKITPEVFNDYIFKFCIVGLESSGKTTIINELSKYLGSDSHTVAEEYGRIYCESKHNSPSEKDYFITHSDLETIAIGHNNLVLSKEHQARTMGKPFMLVDTDHIVTNFFAKRYLGEYNKAINDMCNFQTYDMVFILEPLPLENDGTRREYTDEERVELFKELYMNYVNKGIYPIFISGSIKERVVKILTYMQYFVAPNPDHVLKSRYENYKDKFPRLYKMIISINEALEKLVGSKDRVPEFVTDPLMGNFVTLRKPFYNYDYMVKSQYLLTIKYNITQLFAAISLRKNKYFKDFIYKIDKDLFDVEEYNDLLTYGLEPSSWYYIYDSKKRKAHLTLQHLDLESVRDKCLIKDLDKEIESNKYKSFVITNILTPHKDWDFDKRLMKRYKSFLPDPKVVNERPLLNFINLNLIESSLNVGFYSMILDEDKKLRIDDNRLIYDISFVQTFNELFVIPIINLPFLMRDFYQTKTLDYAIDLHKIPNKYKRFYYDRVYNLDNETTILLIPNLIYALRIITKNFNHKEYVGVFTESMCRVISPNLRTLVKTALTIDNFDDINNMSCEELGLPLTTQRLGKIGNLNGFFVVIANTDMHYLYRDGSCNKNLKSTLITENGKHKLIIDLTPFNKTEDNAYLIIEDPFEDVTISKQNLKNFTKTINITTKCKQ